MCTYYFLRSLIMSGHILLQQESGEHRLTHLLRGNLREECCFANVLCLQRILLHILEKPLYAELGSTLSLEK